MNLLFENWRKYLTEQQEGSFAERNVQKMYFSHTENARGYTAYEVIGRQLYYRFHRLSGEEETVFYYWMEDLLEKLFEQIPPLKAYAVEEVIGLGTKGVAFLMSSGRIVKIFFSGYLPTRNDAGRVERVGEIGDEEMKFYDKEQESFFSGEDDPNALYIISKGSVSAEAMPSQFRKDTKVSMNYVEMVRLVSFNSFLESENRSVEEIEESIHNIVAASTRGEDYTYQDYLLDQEDAGVETDKITSLTQGEFNAINKMIDNTIKKYGKDYLSDLHTANFGITLNTIGDDEPTFVLFDP